MRTVGYSENNAPVPESEATSPAEDLAAALAELGIALTDVENNLRPLRELCDDINAALSEKAEYRCAPDFSSSADENFSKAPELVPASGEPPENAKAKKQKDKPKAADRK